MSLYLFYNFKLFIYFTIHNKEPLIYTLYSIIDSKSVLINKFK
jgi:hypothetical protein